MEADCARGDRSRQCGSRRNGSAVSRFAVPLSRLGAGSVRQNCLPSGHAATPHVASAFAGAAFLLEEQLATDIEQLHFAILHQSGDRCDVAVVEKAVMHRWLAYCGQLGVREVRLLPDVLMLPLATEGWSAVKLAGQWLFRRDRYAGMTVELSWLTHFLSLTAPPVIESYSVPPVPCPGPKTTEWRNQPDAICCSWWPKVTGMMAQICGRENLPAREHGMHDFAHGGMSQGLCWPVFFWPGATRGWHIIGSGSRLNSGGMRAYVSISSCFRVKRR